MRKYDHSKEIPITKQEKIYGKNSRRTYTYIHPNVFNDGDISLFGAEKPENSFLLASIRDLRLDIREQQRLVDINCHPDGQIIPWGQEEGRFLVLQEGLFQWNDELKDYECLFETVPDALREFDYVKPTDEIRQHVYFYLCEHEGQFLVYPHNWSDIGDTLASIDDLIIMDEKGKRMFEIGANNSTKFYPSGLNAFICVTEGIYLWDTEAWKYNKIADKHELISGEEREQIRFYLVNSDATNIQVIYQDSVQQGQLREILKEQCLLYRENLLNRDVIYAVNEENKPVHFIRHSYWDIENLKPFPFYMGCLDYELYEHFNKSWATLSG